MTLVLGLGLPELLLMFVMVALPILAIFVVLRLVRSASRRGTEDALRSAEMNRQQQGPTP